MQRLAEPIVCCELGNLYNKDSVLLALLEKRLPADLSHIRGIKDLKTLHLTNISSDAPSSASAGNIAEAPLFMCPVTAIELNGRHPFLALWTTGWVVSEKAVRELGIDALQAEYGPFSEADMVRLLPTGEEVDAARAAMTERRKNAKATKKRSQAEDGGLEAEGRKAKKRADKDGSEHAESTARPKSSLAVASKVTKEASEEISSQEKSQVFKKLFHKDGERDKSDRDLFMAVAGMRYTLG